MWKSHSSRVYQQRRFWVRFRPVCRSGFALTPTWTIENWIFFHGKIRNIEPSIKGILRVILLLIGREDGTHSFCAALDQSHSLKM